MPLKCRVRRFKESTESLARCNMYRLTRHFLRWRVVSLPLSSQVAGPPLVGYLWLVFQHIRHYPTCRNDKKQHVWRACDMKTCRCTGGRSQTLWWQQGAEVSLCMRLAGAVSSQSEVGFDPEHVRWHSDPRRDSTAMCVAYTSWRRSAVC